MKTKKDSKWFTLNNLRKRRVRPNHLRKMREPEREREKEERKRVRRQCNEMMSELAVTLTCVLVDVYLEGRYCVRNRVGHTKLKKN